jgi:hypothetical protein
LCPAAFAAPLAVIVMTTWLRKRGSGMDISK